ncbi:hypothetical protein VNO78_20852 [Psophocarpus tetragonolobus]|uniref:DUF7870 domain-containing protein n=1 Tax=Psophocarpus tetragonolobus TaxID=3891 RepID=A0AAN9SA11_PSOTE
MDTKYHALSASLARRVFFRALFLASAVSLVSLIRFVPSSLHFTPNSYVHCVHHSDSHSHSQNATLTAGSYLFQSRILNTFWGSFDSVNCTNHTALTSTVVTFLMGKRLLNYGANTLCIGEASPLIASSLQLLGFSRVFSLHNHPYKNHFPYKDSSFHFVFSTDPVPALLVPELERILQPAGIGVLLLAASSSSSSLSSLLTYSNVVHVGYVHELSLVVFKKTSEPPNTGSLFKNPVLPAHCPSLAFTKPFVEFMEPLVEQRQYLNYPKIFSYLPKFVDVSSGKRLVYIDIDVRELVNEDVNVTDWFPPSYPIDHKAFSVYFVHYNASVLLSYVKRPRVTFVYHPGLAGKVARRSRVDGDMDPLLGEEEFDFLVWFKETVQYADFVVLKMNAGEVEMKFLMDIFEDGAICYVHELFLSCSESGDGKSETMSSRERCMDIYKGLRSNGVYVHQWWDAKLHQGPQVSYAQ